ncbi:GPP34 family phosphoprotein [Cryptosporangium phraense]|nr:GPP34 family phosphoprotein [Cryptosporangium phraense]
MQSAGASHQPRHAESNRWARGLGEDVGRFTDPVAADRPIGVAQPDRGSWRRSAGPRPDPTLTGAADWRLADHLYLAAHDGLTGQARLGERATGMLLAGGLLGELLLDGVIGVHSGWLSRRPQQQPRDAVAHTIQAELLADSDVHLVSQWLEFLGTAAPTTATSRVAERLIRDGVLQEVSERRWIFKTESRLQAVSSSRAAWPTARLDGIALRRAQMTVADAVLTGMLDAADLLSTAILSGNSQAVAYMRSRIRVLPPAAADLVAQVRAALGAAILTGRT